MTNGYGFLHPWAPKLMIDVKSWLQLLQVYLGSNRNNTNPALSGTGYLSKSTTNRGLGIT